MKGSWQTTLFGLISAIGTAVVGALATGVIDPSHLPAWVKAAAELAAVVGTAGMGFVARDNNKSSEDVGIKPSGSGVLRMAWLALLVPLCGCVAPLPADTVGGNLATGKWNGKFHKDNGLGSGKVTWSSNAVDGIRFSAELGSVTAVQNPAAIAAQGVAYTQELGGYVKIIDATGNAVGTIGGVAARILLGLPAGSPLPPAMSISQIPVVPVGILPEKPK